MDQNATQSASGDTLDENPWTVLRLLEWTTDYLGKHGSSSPRLDAEVLLSKSLACSRIDLYTSYDKVATKPQRDMFRQLVRERATGAPVAYLVGEREFYSRMFSVTPAVLIPRPESEFVILEMLDRLSQHPVESPTILDVGTGSGVLAVTAALEVPDAQVLGIDISAEALQIAEANAEQHGVSDQVSFQRGDLLSNLSPGMMADVVIANPPYVSEAEWKALDATVRDYEPRTALVSGPTGSEVLMQLIEQAASKLPPQGILVVELSPMIAEQVVAAIESCGSYQATRIRNDLGKRARVVSARRI